MIFRSDTSIENLLMLTPIINELAERGDFSSLRPRIETSWAEIVETNPNISDVDGYFDSDEESFDFDHVSELEYKEHKIDLFAKIALGDTNLSDRRIRIYPTTKEINTVTDWYDKNVPKDKKVIVCWFGERWVDSCPSLEKALIELRKDHFLIEVGRTDFGVDGVTKRDVDLSLVDSEWNLRMIKQLINKSDAYLGFDGFMSQVAFATDTPVAVICSNRNYTYRHPFRGDIPFVIVNAEQTCEHSPFCQDNFAKYQYGFFYSVDCQKDSHVCRTGYCSEDIVRAVSLL